MVVGLSVLPDTEASAGVLRMHVALSCVACVAFLRPRVAACWW